MDEAASQQMSLVLRDQEHVFLGAVWIAWEVYELCHGGPTRRKQRESSGEIQAKTPLSTHVKAEA